MKKDEIIFVDKPKGISSFDVIRILRKKLKIKKMGHAGTLDPLASGLIIIGIGKGTKKLKEFINLDKTYVMEVLLGRRTKTGDLEGEVVEEKQVSHISIKDVKKILQSMEGEIELPVPLYSAIKIKGKPLYKYARAGVQVRPARRKTKIHYLRFLDLKKFTEFGDPISKNLASEKERKEKYYILNVEMKCRKGTYARSVAEEIGKRMNVPATLQNLKRTKIGDFDISQAQNITKFSTSQKL